MADVGPALTPVEADAAFQRALHHNRSRRPCHRFWALNVSGETIGIVALLHQGDSAEVGVMLLPHAWTGRHAKPAITRAIAHAFRTLPIHEVVAESRDGVRERVSRRLLHPHPFERVDAPPGRARWRLSRAAWQSACVAARCRPTGSAGA